MDDLEKQLETAKAAMPQGILDAHEFSSRHRDAIADAQICGCFYCLEIFEPNKIEDWLTDEGTALCPRCGIDSVLPDNVGYPITRDFLTQMKSYWFGNV